MPYSVLILDDDADFNSLLTDIFEQAEYIVTSLTDPLEAVEVFCETDYDLVVSDHRMPEMSGLEFMRAIKKLNPDVPVIMVSGYLENDTIRELISEGVGGVFLKPLNIFSLLERSVELIEESNKIDNAPTGDSGQATGLDARAPLGFEFRSFPCKSGASASFAERLYSLRNFKSTLSLTGEPGMHYRSICEDIRGFYQAGAEQFIYLSSSSFDEAQALSLIEVAKKEGYQRVTCVLLEFESMDASQKMLAASLAKRAGVFADLGIALRAIFCVSGDLDSLFDEGMIDENLYILMGTAEVRVPPLRECDDDLGVMAQQLVVEVAREQSLAAVPRFERSARDLFSHHKWERNFEQLRASVRKIVEDHPGDVITSAAVISALMLTGEVSARTCLESHLSSQQKDYLRAASVFFGGDESQTARFFGVDKSVIVKKFE